MKLVTFGKPGSPRRKRILFCNEEEMKDAQELVRLLDKYGFRLENKEEAANAGRQPWMDGDLYEL